LFFLQRLLLTLMALVMFAPGSTIANPSSDPQLWLPTPLGQPWRVIQGYGCGTHDDWDFYSLDLVAAHGASAGAAVYAAADGSILAWVAPSGTLILDHGNGFYTMYTHLASAVSMQQGQHVPRGTQVGTVGDHGAPGLPHLHFTAFRAAGPWGQGQRQSVPLQFAEGYHLPDIGGCNQYAGLELMSGNIPVAGPKYQVYIPYIQPGVDVPQTTSVPSLGTPPQRRWREAMPLC